MFKESKEMKELHEIREQMYQETKKLSVKQMIEKFRRESQECIKQYGLKLTRHPSLVHS